MRPRAGGRGAAGMPRRGSGGDDDDLSHPPELLRIDDVEPAASIGGDTFNYSLARDLLHLSITDAVVGCC